MKQPTIYDTEMKKRESIAVVYGNANTAWKKEAGEMTRKIAKRQQFFTSDDILIPLEEKGIFTKDNRALAAILLAYSRAGLIQPTGMYITSRRPTRHRGPVMQWQSLILEDK